MNHCNVCCHSHLQNKPSNSYLTPLSTVNTNNNALTELSICCICFETYNRSNKIPILIPCGHTFCKECAEKLVTENVFYCCNCRTVSLLAFSGLSKNADLIKLLDTLDFFADKPCSQFIAVNKNDITDKVYRAVPLKIFSEYSQFFFKLITSFLEFRLGHHYVQVNPVIIQKINDAVKYITDIRQPLKNCIKNLQNVSSNHNSVSLMNLNESLSQSNAVESIDVPVFLRASNIERGAFSSATSSTSSSTLNLINTRRRNKPKKKRNTEQVPRSRLLDWDFTPSHLDF